MTHKEKKQFIKSLTTAVANDLITKVPNMPEEWDGHELRQRLADLFANEVHHDVMQKTRMRNYNSAVASRNV